MCFSAWYESIKSIIFQFWFATAKHIELLGCCNKILNKSNLPLKITQSCVTSKVKNQLPWQSHIIFSWLPLKILLLFQLTPWNFHKLFRRFPRNSMFSTFLFGFFLIKKPQKRQNKKYLDWRNILFSANGYLRSINDFANVRIMFV